MAVAGSVQLFGGLLVPIPVATTAQAIRVSVLQLVVDSVRECALFSAEDLGHWHTSAKNTSALLHVQRSVDLYFQCFVGYEINKPSSY